MPKNVTHGFSKRGRVQPEYRAWAQMRARCLNKQSTVYRHYGGRGIQVCERWALFEAFLSDMGEKPSAAHTLDRIDPNGNYEPSNCRWATWKQQQQNRRNNRIVTYNGLTASLAEVCDANGLKYKTVHARLSKGMPLEVAMLQRDLRGASQGLVKP